MKHSHCCPKCSHRRFAVISEFETRQHESMNTTAPFPVVAVATSGFLPNRRELGHFEVWICERCGLTEWYAQGLAGLSTLAQKFPERVRIVDATE